MVHTSLSHGMKQNTYPIYNFFLKVSQWEGKSISFINHQKIRKDRRWRLKNADFVVDPTNFYL